MFRVDMEAVREAAIEARLMANVAWPANHDGDPQSSSIKLATLAKLAASHENTAEIDPVLADLLQAAMLVCDEWNDLDIARDEMRRDVLKTPPHLRADLLDNFKTRQRS